ncbi:MAG: hypothetical protein ACRD30_10875, partial [Bryobacteraceae bacterium]
LELADFLAAHGSGQQLLAELLPLEAGSRNDPGILKQVARLYLAAGSPQRSMNIYAALIHDNPADPANYTGFGEAELALGDYRRAQTAFQNALRHGAPEKDLEPQIQLAQTLSELDPTPRPLSSVEKLSRADRILQLARDALALCPGAQGAAQKIADADKLLSAQIQAPANELAEQRLSMAQNLWRARTAACGSNTPAEMKPLSLILSKLAM